MVDQEMLEEVAIEVDQEVELEEGAGVVGIAENDEVEAKTQENPNLHPTSRQERKNEVQSMSLRCGTRYDKWSGDTPQVWMTQM